MTFLAAFRGALVFLTRIPAPVREGDWEAFRSSPWTFPAVGYVLGVLVAVPFLATESLPATTIAFGYVLAVYAATGINHLDGVSDLGDAVVVHGDVATRREVLKDTTTGVGALLALVLVVSGLVLGGLELATLSLSTAVGIVVAAEVGAKFGMATMACFGEAPHDGMGATITDGVGPAGVVGPALLVAPVAVLTAPHPAATAALVGALVGTGLPWLYAERKLGGINGDIFGAANEIGRLLAVHAGVIAWTLW